MCTCGHYSTKTVVIVAHLGVSVWAGSSVSGGAAESTSVLMSVRLFQQWPQAVDL